jgi:two-component system, chemotaxis family, chemotaxis protein CheY
MKRNVLIVDDSEFTRNYHSYILREANFEVVTAVDGADALEKLYSRSFDLVLTDINMANMDGYEFIRQVRSNADYTDLPIIIISTESEAEDKSRGFIAGANFYIVKPSDPKPLIENICMVLGIDNSPIDGPRGNQSGDLRT